MPAHVPAQALPTSPGLAGGTQIAAGALVIRLSVGTGSGPTALSAFDSALGAAGVGEYNLVRLSSVIPPGTELARVDGARQVPGEWGDRLYCVYASQVATEPGGQAWAGIGWVRLDDGSGAGLFVEHEGSSRADVEGQILASLERMTHRRAGTFTPPEMVLASAVCAGEPVCALVVAGYETAGWTRG